MFKIQDKITFRTSHNFIVRVIVITLGFVPVEIISKFVMKGVLGPAGVSVDMLFVWKRAIACLFCGLYCFGFARVLQVKLG